ncbi:GNAT family N-acetyltransferase [Pedobacter sp. ASV28]|uniref:GNAT family N-acetyltransferase n=1 Tax=Pedobacter sp. ASV28 TaxID=2795123 RepID=UPI0018EA935A|nr:GNAT family N-acetyltransferase [Pedobacter sp. ASV28]
MIEIRRALKEDPHQLQKIGRSTFLETFVDSNTEQNMNNYLEEAFSLEKLITELSDESSQFYFATLQNRVIGYLKINIGHAQTELKDADALEIERIYVSKDFHGKKVGQLLYEKAIDIANKLNVAYVWLGVWEKNSRAISFYQKNGFVEFDKHIFTLGNEEQTDMMMKKKL